MPSRLSRAVVPFAVVAALVASDGARAHGRHGTADGDIATFSALKPNVVGVLVNVYGPQNLFRLSNYSGKTVVVLGARREPYLRFTQSAVYENAAAPTAYLNAARAVPPSARADADPRWRKVRRARRTRGTSTESSVRNRTTPTSCTPSRTSRI